MHAILVVEGDEAHALLLKKILENKGEVHIALKGQDALRLAAETRLDLLITGLKLPDTDGWSLIEEIRKTSEIPILVITAYIDVPSKNRAYAAGCTQYLIKPYQIAELREIVGRFLAK